MGQRFRLGVDIGGTFTDFVLFDEGTGRGQVMKVPSTPEHPSAAVADGIRALAEAYGADTAAIDYFVHGTTLGVNTVIQRSGARVGLLVTEGFRDLMGMGRSRLPDTYNFLVEKPAPLVPRRWVAEIGERMLHSGQVLRPLDEAAAVAAAGRLVAEGVEALAIAFLHSYRNDAHERQAKAAVERAFPGLYVCASAEIWPQMREYERALVCVINAFIGRRLDDYFGALIGEVSAGGIDATVFTTKSNGGIMRAATARRVPVETLSSGPAAGVMGARFIGGLAGFSRIIGLDMGGTSTEVSVIDGEIRYATETRVGDFYLVTPAVDVTSIGAGGGSVAWCDAAGVLKVGPHSAGALPGPACYGLGGTEPTVTDAYVVTGIIDPGRFLGGGMRLQPDLAGAAIDRIAGRLDLNRVRAAEGVLRVATANMYSTLVPLMAQKGVDLRDFALLLYGGAGPTHGFMLAREVGIGTVLVPPNPGALCALGSLVADVKSDFIKTVKLAVSPGDAPAAAPILHAGFRELDQQAGAWLDHQRVEVLGRRLQQTADMRYLGQSFELQVDVTGADLSSAAGMQAFLDAFHQLYAQTYGYSDREAVVEVIHLRTTVAGITPKPQLARPPERPGDARPIAHQRIYFEGRELEAGVFDRSELRVSQVLAAPVVIHQYDSTVFVPPGFSLQVDPHGILVGERMS